MTSFVGWLLDAYIQSEEAALWFVDLDGRRVRLTAVYSPFFHVKPRSQEDGERLTRELEACAAVDSFCIEPKRTSLGSCHLEPLIRINVTRTKEFHQLVRGLEENDHVSDVYNADFKHVQRYLLTQLQIEPTSKVVVEHDSGRLVSIERVDDSMEIAPPPFSMIRFRTEVDVPSGRISWIEINTERGQVRLEGLEKEVIASFLNYVELEDPDFLFCPKCEEEYNVLEARAKATGVEFELRRCSDAAQVRGQGSLAGRVVLGDVFYGYSADKWGIAGLVERARFAFAPPGLATRWKSNRSIDSRNCFELLRRGYAIPRACYFECARSLSELMKKDRGGIAITPEEGLYENVGAIDFDSQFPSIIIKERLSYELQGDESFRLIPQVIAPFTTKRILLKRIEGVLQRGSDVRRYCRQRIEALKMIAVTQYGISGCCWNRFGNVLTFEAINEQSRKAMVVAKRTAEHSGFSVIYGDVDSVFVSKKDASREEYEKLAAAISAETGLPASLDRHFKFIGFLRTRDGLVTALKRYLGITYDGEIEARGIEMRRADAPEFVKRFQASAICAVLDCENLEEVRTLGVRRGRELLDAAIRAIELGAVDTEELTVTKCLRKEPGKYMVNTAQRSAALQLIASGREVRAGDSVQYVFVDVDHANHMCRVEAKISDGMNYDREEYTKIILRAAKTVFSAVGAELETI